jgi:high-affinity iron transporter
MTAAVAMVMLLSVAFAGNAVNQLQNLDLLPATSLRDEIPRLPVALGELTGIHPTVESLATQMGLLIIYASGLAIVRLTARRRATAMPAPAQAEVGL